jgi:16S rRNA (guanine966-N2)-methyltransferase
LFNILMNDFDLEEVEVLDLFSGTGSITYEFASRGARSVVCVESDPSHFRFIRKTCSELNLDMVTVIRGDVFRFLNRPARDFDIIFADPPYDHPRLGSLPDLVTGTGILAGNGKFILEHPSRYSFTAHPAFLEERRYGGVHLSFFASPALPAGDT